MEPAGGRERTFLRPRSRPVLFDDRGPEGRSPKRHGPFFEAPIASSSFRRFRFGGILVKNSASDLRKEFENRRFFLKKKFSEKNIPRKETVEQQRCGFGGRPFSHEKIEVMLTMCCKKQYETRPPVTRELNNNIY